MTNQKRIKREGVTRKMSKSNKVEKLKRSKKYAAGREYNTLEGRIKIINRYLENGEIMISYLNMKTDEIIIKGELDVNSMLYAYTKEIAQKAQPKEFDADEGKYLTKEVEALRSESEALEREIENLKEEKKAMQKIMDQQFELIGSLMEQLKIKRG